MKGYFELEQKRFEIEEDIKNKQKQLKKLEKDKELEIKQYNNDIFWRHRNSRSDNSRTYCAAAVNSDGCHKQ